jgi:hypothetical protein
MRRIMRQDQIDKYFGNNPYLRRIAESRVNDKHNHVDIQARNIVHQCVDLVEQLVHLQNSVFDLPTHFDYRLIEPSIDAMVDVAEVISKLVIKEVGDG